MSRIRKLASETAIYGVSSVLGRAVNFLLFPFYSQVFAPEAYEPVVTVYAAFVFLNILYQYGMESAYLKFASDGGPDRRPVFSSAVWSLAGTSALLSTLIWFGRGAAADVQWLGPEVVPLFGFAAAILFLDTACVVPYAELRLSNRPVYFAVVRLASVAVNVAGNLILILEMGMGVEAVLIANVASSWTAILMLSPVFRQNLRWTLDRTLWRKMLRFGLPFLPGGLGYAVSQTVNIFFLAEMSPEDVVRLYGDAMPAETLAKIDAGDVAAAGDFVVGVFGGMIKLAVIAGLAVQMFRYAWQPFFLNHASDDDAPALFGRVFLILTGGIFGLVLLVSFFAAELVAIPLPGDRTLVDSSFWLGLSFIPIALLGYAFQGWYYHFSAGAYIQKKTDYFVACTLAGSVVALGVNYFAVPQFGMIGAAWATAAAYATMAMCLFVLIRPHYKVPYHWPRALTMVLAAVGGLLAWHTYPGLQVWWAELGMLAAFGLVSAATLAGGMRRVSATAP